MQYKNIYAVRTWVSEFNSFGLQYIKGNTVQEAKQRFRKRYPKKLIISAGRIFKQSEMYNTAKNHALYESYLAFL